MEINLTKIDGQLEEKRQKLIKEIKSLDSEYIIIIYKKAKELYDITKREYPNYNYGELSLDLGYDIYWAKKLFILDEFSEKTWILINLGSLNMRLAMRVMNHIPETIRKNQDEIFEKIVKEDMNQLQAYNYLNSKYKLKFDKEIIEQQEHNYERILHRELGKIKQMLMFIDKKNLEEQTIREINEIIDILREKNLIRNAKQIEYKSKESIKTHPSITKEQKHLLASFGKTALIDWKCFVCGGNHKEEFHKGTREYTDYKLGDQISR